MNKARKWADLGRLLGYGGVPGLSTQMRWSYIRVIHPYEEFCERVRASPALASLTTAARDPQLRTHVNTQMVSKQATASATPAGGTRSASASGGQQQTTPMRGRPRAVSAVESPPSSPLTESSSPLSEPPDDNDYAATKKEQASRAYPFLCVISSSACSDGLQCSDRQGQKIGRGRLVGGDLDSFCLCRKLISDYWRHGPMPTSSNPVKSATRMTAARRCSSATAATVVSADCERDHASFET